MVRDADVGGHGNSAASFVSILVEILKVVTIKKVSALFCKVASE